jgi:hypothetical protein
MPKARLLLPAGGLALVLILAYACSSKAAAPARAEPASAPRVIAAPAAGQAPHESTAEVRFANAMPGSGGLELLLDSTSLFSNVVYSAVSPYKHVSDQVTRVAVRVDASKPYDALQTTGLHAGNRYTVIAVPEMNDGMRLRVLHDERATTEGQARLRFIHAAPFLGRVDLAIAGADETLFTSVGPGSDDVSCDIPAASASLDVRDTATGNVLLSVQRTDFVAGGTYTFVLTSASRGVLRMIAFSDAPAAMRVVSSSHSEAMVQRLRDAAAGH